MCRISSKLMQFYSVDNVGGSKDLNQYLFPSLHAKYYKIFHLFINFMNSTNNYYLGFTHIQNYLHNELCKRNLYN